MGEGLIDVSILLTFNKLKTLVKRAQLDDADADAMVSQPIISFVHVSIGGKFSHQLLVGHAYHDLLLWIIWMLTCRYDFCA